jgi:hypothetical protein
MKKNSKILSILLVVIAIGIIIYLNLIKKSYNWDESYDPGGKDPYDTYAITEMLKNNSRGSKLHIISDATDSTFSDSRGLNVNYVFIGNELWADSTRVNKILDFVGRGNTAFVSAEEIPVELVKIITDECETGFFVHTYDASCRTTLVEKFNAPLVTLKYNYDENLVDHDWLHIDSSAFCAYGDKITILGHANGKVNYIKFPYGKGNLYIHSTPLIFTNYFLVKTDAQKYAENALTVLGDGDIFLDEWSKIPGYGDGGHGGVNSPLQFILSQKSLRWAWYSALGFLILYMIFFGKRRQKTIPVIERIKNTSIEYTKTVGILYFLERSHRTACINKMKHFQLFLRNRYKIPLTKVSTALIEKIHLVSGVDKNIIENIFEDYEHVDKKIGITDQQLIEFHNKLSAFYKNCK